ncbi:hypothetical protein HY68_06490 [Streptomyces sp. AcH 505]|nr:hypothetical protein HY68_06490 [Streptomyces sp. AcH 505]
MGLAAPSDALMPHRDDGAQEQAVADDRQDQEPGDLPGARRVARVDGGGAQRRESYDQPAGFGVMTRHG